jgi:hypothetical protein
MTISLLFFFFIPVLLYVFSELDIREHAQYSHPTMAQIVNSTVHLMSNNNNNNITIISSNQTSYLDQDAKNFTIKLNVEDTEFVDLCAIRSDGRFRIIPPEQGYVNEYENEYAERLSPEAGEIQLTLRITSSNAQPVERTLRLHSVVDHFPDQCGRIIEFLNT